MIIFPYITNNIPHITTQHGCKRKHSTDTTLHNINNAIVIVSNQNQPPAHTITVVLHMNNAFDTVYIHKLINKLINTSIHYTIIAPSRDANITFRNTSTQRLFRTGVSQGGVLSPTLFNINSQTYTYSPTYIVSTLASAQSNKRILNSDKATCTVLTHDPAAYNTKLNM